MKILAFNKKVIFLATAAFFYNPVLFAQTIPPVCQDAANVQRPVTVTEQFRNAPVVFAGNVTNLQGDTATVTVSQYFKGSGPTEVVVHDLKQDGCNRIDAGQPQVFFGEADSEEGVRPVTQEGYQPVLPANQIVDKLTANLKQDQVLTAENCAAVFDGKVLHVPCVKIEGSEEIYQADLVVDAVAGGGNMRMLLIHAQKHQPNRPQTGRDQVKPVANRPQPPNNTNQQPPQPQNPPINQNPAVEEVAAAIESVTVQILKSNPVQVAVVVKGNLRDGCETLKAPIREAIPLNAEGIFKIAVPVNRQTGQNCVQMITPFETRFFLNINGLKAGEYTVVVNDVKATFMLEAAAVVNPPATDNPTNPPQSTTAGVGTP